MDEKTLRYNCLDLATKVGNGSEQILHLAAVFYAFVHGVATPPALGDEEPEEGDH